MAEETKQYTEIGKLGEFGLIDRLTEKIKLVQPSTIKGVGDDAAVIATEKDKLLLFSTDMMVENVHFDLTYTPLRHLGYKAVSSNVSDICAMNGDPTQIVVSLAISNQYSVEALEEIYKGMRFACEEYGIDLVGGDTTSSISGLMISVAILGKVSEKEVTYRSGAKKGDFICVSGDLGGAYAGLLLLQKAKGSFKNDPSLKPDLFGYGYVLQRQLMPHARIEIVKLLKTLGIVPTSMIDISDGLSSEINHLCKASDVGCMIYEEKIPINEEVIKVAEEFQTAPTMFPLSGGEDYELLFTVSPEDLKKIKGNEGITVIGEITEAFEGICLMDKNNHEHIINPKGWDSFEKKEN
jgi:thiamine-monophosphate kinase